MQTDVKLKGKHNEMVKNTKNLLLKQMLEYEKNESNRNLAQVHRLKQRLD
jgi:hypothetical protein